MSQLALVQIKGNTYYIPAPTNIGVYVENKTAILIDSGNDKESGRQILKLLNQQGWSLQLIINTHSNADHIGGNAFLQEKTGCKIAATPQEAAFINNPLLEPAFLYGGYPMKGMQNKFLMAKPSLVTDLIAGSGEILATGLVAMPLPGHFFEMIGVLTPDNIVFIADSLFPENIINKYHLFFLLDLKAHLQTLDELAKVEAELYVPSHGQAVSDLRPLIAANKREIEAILAAILAACKEPVTTDEVMGQICALYQVSLNATQYVLINSTIRSYLTYLCEENLLDYGFNGGKLVWKRK